MSFNIDTSINENISPGIITCLSFRHDTMDKVLNAYVQCMCDRGMTGYCPKDSSIPSTTATPWRRRTTSRRPRTTTTTARAHTTGVGLTSGTSAGDLPWWRPTTTTTTITTTTITRNYHRKDEAHRGFSDSNGPRLIFLWTCIAFVLLVFIATFWKLRREKRRQTERRPPPGLTRAEPVGGFPEPVGGVTEPADRSEAAPALVRPSAPRPPSDLPSDLPPPYEQVAFPSPPPYELIYEANPGRTSAGWRRYE